MPGPDQIQDVEGDFSQVALGLFASGTVEGTLQQIVNLAERTVEGCDAAGVLILAGGTATTAAASNPLAVALDRMQLDADEGPSLDASTGNSTFYVQDLVEDARWPRFGSAAVDASVRSVLAYSLSAERPSALNLYARLPGAFGAIDRAKGQLFATLARLALDAAEERAADEQRAAHLTEALRTRALIGQAQGILIERERITAEQAFTVLRRASQHLNIKLREVAETLVETGETPNTGPRHRSRGRRR